MRCALTASACRRSSVPAANVWIASLVRCLTGKASALHNPTEVDMPHDKEPIWKQIRFIKTANQLAAFAIAVVVGGWGYLTRANFQWSARTLGIITFTLIGLFAISSTNSLAKKHRPLTLLSLIVLIGTFICILVLAIQDVFQPKAVEMQQPLTTANRGSERALTPNSVESDTRKDLQIPAHNTNSPERSAFVGSTNADMPSVRLTTPTEGSTISNTVALTASASDVLGITNIEFYTQAETLIGTVNKAPFSINWDTSKIPNGTTAVYAKVYTVDGRSAVSPINRVLISNSAH